MLPDLLLAGLDQMSFSPLFRGAGPDSEGLELALFSAEDDAGSMPDPRRAVSKGDAQGEEAALLKAVLEVANGKSIAELTEAMAAEVGGHRDTPIPLLELA